ncbi:MAG: hypothetical protein OXF48_02505 [Bacteroidetes bacterium]|nr:hypothetical protein [Bacteroidota bacterium]
MQNFSFFSCALFAFTIFSGCETEQLPEFTEEDLAELIPYAPLGRGLQGSLDTTTIQVISDADIWTAYTDSLQPLVPFKAVDFQLETILLAAVKVHSGGYDLRFEPIESLRDTVVATYRLFSPGEDCRPSFAPGIPFEAIRIPRTLRPVRFVQVVEEVDCSPS